jgi:hypothetical protein
MASSKPCMLDLSASP